MSIPLEASTSVAVMTGLVCEMPEQTDDFVDGFDGSVDRGFLLETDMWGRATVHDAEAYPYKSEEWYTAFRVRGQWAQWGK